MEKKFSLILDKEFIDYCELNKIDDIEKFAKEVFTKGFNLTKYGNRPSSVTPQKPILKQESLPNEKIVEVVEKTKEKIRNSNLYDE